MAGDSDRRLVDSDSTRFSLFGIISVLSFTLRLLVSDSKLVFVVASEPGKSPVRKSSSVTRNI